jgi:hypothetical protein
MDRRKLQEALKDRNYRKIAIERGANGFIVEGFVSNGHSYKFCFESLDNLMSQIDIIVDALDKDYTSLVIEGAFGEHSRGIRHQ